MARFSRPPKTLLTPILEHMEESVFWFGKDGSCSTCHSRSADRLFGPGLIDSLSITDLLFSGREDFDPELLAFQQLLQDLFGVSEDQWEAFCEILPTELMLDAYSESPRILTLKFIPEFESDSIARVMVVVREITDERAMRDKLNTLSEQVERQKAQVPTLLGGQAQMCVQFLKDAEVRIGKLHQRIAHGSPNVDLGELRALYLHAHTVGGEAGIFDLVPLSKACRDLADLLSALSTRARNQPFVPLDMFDGRLVTLSQAAVEALCTVQQEVTQASPYGPAVMDYRTVPAADIARLLQVAGNREDELGDLARRLSCTPLADYTARVVAATPQWAAAENKVATTKVEGLERLVPPSLAVHLKGVLRELVKNAIEHSLETPQEREDAGKNPVGCIRIRAIESELGPVISIDDDGMGIQFNDMRDAAEQLCMDSEEVSPIELILKRGFTTKLVHGKRVGLGLGLSAARAWLADSGYRIDLGRNAEGKICFLVVPGASLATLGIKWPEAA